MDPRLVQCLWFQCSFFRFMQANQRILVYSFIFKENINLVRGNVYYHKQKEMITYVV